MITKKLIFCINSNLINFLCISSNNKQQDADDRVKDEENKAINKETMSLSHVRNAEIRTFFFKRPTN